MDRSAMMGFAFGSTHPTKSGVPWRRRMGSAKQSPSSGGAGRVDASSVMSVMSGGDDGFRLWLYPSYEGRRFVAP